MRKATNIIWDCDEGEEDLPETVVIPDEIEEDEVTDYLSDKYEWLVCSYSLEEGAKDEQDEDALHGWEWYVSNTDGDVLGKGFDYKTVEEADAAAKEYVKKNGITNYLLEISQLMPEGMRCFHTIESHGNE